MGNDGMFVDHPPIPNKSNEPVDDSSDFGYTTFGLRYPAYYYFTLEAHDVLIFNSGSMCHQFTNLTGKEDIFTLRWWMFNASPDILCKQGFISWKHMWTIAEHIVTKKNLRKVTSTKAGETAIEDGVGLQPSK